MARLGKAKNLRNILDMKSACLTYLTKSQERRGFNSSAKAAGMQQIVKRNFRINQAFQTQSNHDS
tara:strand:- start:85332 stop:85526 length:195 start_codon:yes stop_codon:yes gene_type:complete